MRIQILELPSVVVGDDLQQPFALIVDQWPHDLNVVPTQVRAEEERRLVEFAAQCGARAHFICGDTVQVVDPYAPQPEPRIMLQPPHAVAPDPNKVAEYLDGRAKQLGVRSVAGQ